MSALHVLWFTIAVVFGLLVAETRIAWRNQDALVARGATIPDGDVWFWMKTMYPLALILMALEGTARVTDATPIQGGPNWFAAGLLLFLAGKALKYWAIATLGERWTYRVMVLPGAPLLATGPYRYVTHPNYIAIFGELGGTAMMMGALITGPVMTILFGFVLWGRIRFENRVLEAIRATRTS